jgi:hypothetical protein
LVLLFLSSPCLRASQSGRLPFVTEELNQIESEKNVNLIRRKRPGGRSIRLAATAMAPPSRDYWLGFFRGAGDNVFDAIDAAITVAASDHPVALRQRRDGIAERLYTALLVAGATAAGPGAAAAAQGAAVGTAVVGAPMPAQLHPEGAASVPSLCSSDRAEAITDDSAPRRDDSVLAEAERIKAILLNDQDKVPLLLPSPSTAPPPFVRPVTDRRPVLNLLCSLVSVGGRVAGAAPAAAAAGPHDGHPGGETTATSAPTNDSAMLNNPFMC